MLAVVYGIKTFEYELRGRKFHPETDHKALGNIRTKPFFENDRINRWIDIIQEYDFTVSYVKGKEIGMADTLSRKHGYQIILSNAESTKV